MPYPPDDVGFHPPAMGERAEDEGMGTIVPTEKARQATASEWKRVHAHYGPKPKIEA